MKRAIKRKITTTAERITQPIKLKTIIDGEVETEKQGYPGDFIITGPKGEKYIIDSDKFNERWKIISDDENILHIESKPVEITYAIADKDFEFTASWGEKMVAKKGDAIVYKIDYRIEKEIFNQTYKTKE